MKFKFFFIAALTLGPLSAQELLTPEQALSLTLENNFGILVSKISEAQAENNASLLNKGFLPTLTATSVANINMKKDIVHYIIFIEDNDIVEAYDTRRPFKSVLLLFLKKGYYLGFVHNDILKDDIENQFSEVLYENKILLIRHKDIVKRIL